MSKKRRGGGLDMSLMMGMLSQFGNQPQAQAPGIKSLMLPIPGQAAREAEKMREFEQKQRIEDEKRARLESLNTADAYQNILHNTPTHKDVHSPNPESPFGDLNVESVKLTNAEKTKRTLNSMILSGDPALQREGLEKRFDLSNEGVLGAEFRNKQTVITGGKDKDGNRDPNLRQLNELTPDGRIIPLGDPIRAFNDKLWGTDTGYSNIGGEEVISKRIEEGVAKTEAIIKDTAFLSRHTEDMATADLLVGDFLGTIDVLKDLEEETSGWTTGVMGLTRYLPHAPARSWENIKKAVVSRIGLEKLTKMKAETKTGASGLGQLNEKELEILTNFMGTLDGLSDPKAIRSQIGKIRTHLEKSIERMKIDARKAEDKFREISSRDVFKGTGFERGADRIPVVEYLGQPVKQKELESRLNQRLLKRTR